MFSVTNENFAVVTDPVSCSGESKPAIEVFTGSKRLIKAKALKNPGACSDGDEDMAAPRDDCARGRIASRRANIHVIFSVIYGVPEELRITVDQVEFRMLAEKSCLLFQVIR